MDGRLSDDNVATRKGASAVEVELKFQPSSSTTSLTTQICTTNFLDSLATIIVGSVGRTHKSLLRLHCTQQSTIKVQILGTYVPVKNMRSNDDVALELQRQLSFADSPFRINVSNIDPTYRPPPVNVINCSEDSLIFEPICTGENGSKGLSNSSLASSAWLGLEPHSYSTILIFVSAALLVCLLCLVGGLCFRRFWRNKKRVKDKTKWIVAVQQEQAMELETAKARPAAKNGSQSHHLLPTSIAIPSLPVVSRAATPSPSPRSVPPLKDPDSMVYQDYACVETPPASEEENPCETTEVVYVLEECDESTYLAAQETPTGGSNLVAG